MVNKKWLISMGILSGLVIGASTVKADTNTNVNNEVTSAAVTTNAVAQQSGNTAQSTNNVDGQSTNAQAADVTTQAQAATSQANGVQQAPANSQATTSQDNVTVSAPKATYYYPNQWYGKKNYDGSTTWNYFKSDGTRAEYEWLWINGFWYFFEGGGDMAAYGWVSDNHYNEYYFDAKTATTKPTPGTQPTTSMMV